MLTVVAQPFTGNNTITDLYALNLNLDNYKNIFKNDSLLNLHTGDFKRLQQSINQIEQAPLPNEKIELLRSRKIPVTKGKITLLMKQAIYSSRYAINEVEKDRNKYKIDPYYQLAFQYGTIRQLRLLMVNIYGAAYSVLRTSDTTLITDQQKLIIITKMYGEVVKRNLDVSLIYDVFVKLENNIRNFRYRPKNN